MTGRQTSRRTGRWAPTRASFGAVASLLAIAVFLSGWELSPNASAAPPESAPVANPVVAAPAASAMVKITFITVPSSKAMVFWGKKRLGVIAPHQPLVIQRPRDSGPLDVIVRSQGYLSVQTRAYTFADSKVAVKLTTLDQKNTLLGYREEPPPSDDPAAAALPPGAAAPPGAPVAAPPPPGGAAADAGTARR